MPPDLAWDKIYPGIYTHHPDINNVVIYSIDIFNFLCELRVYNLYTETIIIGDCVYAYVCASHLIYGFVYIYCMFCVVCVCVCVCVCI